jgi:two-component system cell cycle sensor histidine kinase/response regulator CckA
MGEPAERDLLRTASVPDDVAPLFLRAQEYVRRYFADRVENPENASILISGERYILVRAASMSVEFFDMVSSLYADRGAAEAGSVARNILYDVAHSIGQADARSFQQRMNLTDPIERLSAGPIHFSFCGWAYVKIFPESRPTPDTDYYLLYDHPFSFESDAWLRAGRRAPFPVCVMNAGYSSGWCEESFGQPLVAAEVECMACGDSQCRFIMAPPDRIEEHIAHFTRRRSASHPMPDDRYMPVTVPEYFQRKRMEEALRSANEQLERRVEERTAELAAANKKLQAEMIERELAEQERRKVQVKLLHAQKLESLGVLAGGIAHDFNNLLVGILGNAGIALQEVPDDHPVQQTLHDIETAALRASDLTRQMLAYAGKGQFLIQPVDLSSLVEEMANLLASAASRSAKLTYQFERGLPPVDADATQLRQVVMNLITNASEALGPGGGSIVVSTGRMRADRAYLAETNLGAGLPEGEYVYVEVKDDGHGMHAATLARIFDPFFTTKFTGRGLGLAAVLGIVRTHHGAIKVVSAPGEGTTMRVLLPSAATAAERPVAAPAPAETLPEAGGSVLIVDDEETVRAVAKRMLERAGYTVTLASGGLEAVHLFREHPAAYDVVLLDLTMPGQGGLATHEELCRIRPDVKVVFSSGFTPEEMHNQAGRSLGAEFVQKPYRPADLLAAVRRAQG